MDILILGSGGREHALAWKAAQSPLVNKVFVAPGNAGTAAEPKCHNIGSYYDFVQLAKDYNIGLTIVGPEQPLARGIVDEFQSAGMDIFGPTQLAAQLESSKSFAKDFMNRWHIPTAGYRTCTNMVDAEHYISSYNAWVIKEDGLAGGKGVTVASSVAEALEAAQHAIDQGKTIVVESKLEGEEASFIVACDHNGNVVPLASSQDHKRAHDGDVGPNTGGMGAYSPMPLIDYDMHERIMNEIVHPTLKGMDQEGATFTGFLYVGLMLCEDGPKVIEFNVRGGDPETQPIMMRMQSDLVEMCQYAMRGELDQYTAKWNPHPAVSVVLATNGYPAFGEPGHIIQGLGVEDTLNVKVFHAGTATKGQDIVTNGGRVLSVCATGPTLQAAQTSAYARADQICWDGRWYRTDIGHRSLTLA